MINHNWLNILIIIFFLFIDSRKYFKLVSNLDGNLSQFKFTINLFFRISQILIKR